jgi:glycosyltransferase involved in cell wall biosynthesis
MRISTVIPTYNRARLLAAAIESVLAQTRPPDEILVVDDGSTDGTPAVAARFGPLVRLLSQPNRGPAAARNHGLREARHEWIAFLDSDDLWAPTKLEKQASLARKGGGLIVLCDSDSIDGEGRPLRGHHRRVHGGQVTARLFARTFVHTPAVLAQAALLQALGGFDESLRVCEDYDLWLRASLRTEFLLVPEPLLLRRVHAESLAHQRDPRHHEDRVRVLERFAADPEARARLSPGLRRRRLARVNRQAARAFLAHGDRQRARTYARAAAGHAPWSLRALATWIRTLGR